MAKIRIRDGKNSDPGFGMEKVRMRDAKKPVLLATIDSFPLVYNKKSGDRKMLNLWQRSRTMAILVVQVFERIRAFFLNFYHVD
jgi:hypothetical protein